MHGAALCDQNLVRKPNDAYRSQRSVGIDDHPGNARATPLFRDMASVPLTRTSFAVKATLAKKTK